MLNVIKAGYKALTHFSVDSLGTYNYPISFSIPANCPPTIHADFGSVTYRLKATVVRVGALSPNYVEEQEVTLIASPGDDDLEETENVIVERQWEDQLRYVMRNFLAFVFLDGSLRSQISSSTLWKGVPAWRADVSYVYLYSDLANGPLSLSPMSLRFMPMSKCKIYRLSAMIEGKQ